MPLTAPRLEVKGMWPYWKDEASSVTNDIVLDRTVLLTGPNMAGERPGFGI